MVHHAVLGSLERFIGMLLEHWKGRLPGWLAPEQVLVASVGEAQAGYAAKAHEALLAAGFRSVLDDSQDTLSKKALRWREAALPALAVAGEREVEGSSLSVRRLGSQAAEIVPLARVAESLSWLNRVGAA
jgi:threonyl-tRNA synthetase